MISHAPPADWRAAHRDVWARKASLRTVYRSWFRALRTACVPGAPIVELGCGPGFLKESYPEVIATDVAPSRYADRVADAAALPFADGEIGTIVFVDVFHHLAKPEGFLREAARTLRLGGRLVMIEPWMGLAGRLLFRYAHHEDCDLHVSPADPWGAANKDPMQGNAALPYIFFRAGGHVERMRVPLRVIQRTPSASLPWILTGGFQPIGLLPSVLVSAVEVVDRLVSLAPSVTATRCFLVLEKTEPSK
jgi:SAM-dependent methyltransferase